MSKIISINLLIHGRIKFLELTKLTLSNISNKDKIVLNLLSSNGACETTNSFAEYMNDIGIETTITHFDAYMNYMDKIHHAINNKYEYSFNVDDDCFFSTELWDFIIDNIPDVLSNDENLLFAPCLSNGIPACDYFMADVATRQEKNTYKQLISENGAYLTKFIAGCDYTFLREFTDPWKEEDFYNAVSNMDHYYKGVHPVRFATNLQEFINSIILNKVQQFKNPKNIYLDYVDNRPYMCNSAFAIKTSTWKRIIQDPSLRRDEFDEVQINLYRQNNNLKMAFARNAFGIHMFYNTINNRGAESEFYNKFITEFKK